MKTGFNGLELIKSFEGLHLKAYLDPVGIPTIGYGHIRGVKMGQVITEQEATAFLQEDLAYAEHAVNTYVTVPLNQNQFDALVSFVFNLGAGTFQKSWLLRDTNLKKFEQAANEFPRFVYAGGVKLRGLVRRREAEKALYLAFAEPEKEEGNAKLIKAINEEIKANSDKWHEHAAEQQKLNKRNTKLRSLLSQF